VYFLVFNMVLSPAEHIPLSSCLLVNVEAG